MIAVDCDVECGLKFLRLARGAWRVAELRVRVAKRECPTSRAIRGGVPQVSVAMPSLSDRRASDALLLSLCLFL